MPVYEIVLQFADREELRVTDRPVAMGDELEILGKSWTVVGEREPEENRASGRFVCEMTNAPRSQAIEMRIEDEELRHRLEERGWLTARGRTNPSPTRRTGPAPRPKMH